jgi:hypothetical protein
MAYIVRLAFGIALFGPASLPAATILDSALGTTLAGGIVTVTRFGGGLSSATFVADGLGGASAVSPGSAGFSLVVTPGDTSAATWTLTNTDTSLILLNRITAVTIDLTLTGRALFDNGATPSTPLSGPGVAGVTPVGGVGIVSAGEFAAWPDPANTGDMFLALTIGFAGGFTALASSSWTDDTDFIDIPEPFSFGLCAGALAVLLIRTRGRAQKPRPAA